MELYTCVCVCEREQARNLFIIHWPLCVSGGQTTKLANEMHSLCDFNWCCDLIGKQFQ